MVAVLVAVVPAACGDRTPQELGDPVAASVPSLAEVDWHHVTYASVCGLSDVVVYAGVGETKTRGEVFGVEVVDAALGELDGVEGDEAAILLDCLGADSYRPHVLVVGPSGLMAGRSLAVVAASGGSVAPGDRPLRIDIVDRGSASSGSGSSGIGSPGFGSTGSIEVTVDDGAGAAVHRLAFAPHVLRGGELGVVAGSTAYGVLVAVEESDTGAVLVVAVGPDDGYRIPAPSGLASVDPDDGVTKTPDGLIGRGVEVGTDGSGVATSLTVMSAGAA